MSAPRAELPRSASLALGIAVAAAAASVGLPATALLAGGLMVIAAGLAIPDGAWHGSPRRRLIAIGLGMTLLCLRLIAGPAAVPPPDVSGDARGPWLATVESMGSPRNGAQTARLRLSLENGTVLVAATLPAFPEVSAGWRVSVDGWLQPPPADDPYGEYLRRSGASGSLRARSVTVVERSPTATLQSTRDAAGDALRLALPEPEAGLAAGILIGLRERVDRQLAADFATAGVSHVVAISGWNIAIVASLVGALLRGRPRRLVAMVVAGTIVAYVIAAGASPSVVRAAVMAAVVLIARESGRAGRATAALAWAAAVLLLADPGMIGDAGFRLSVLATAGLLAWATPLGGWIGRLGGGRVPGWLAESLGISLAAQAATLPDVMVTFGRLSLVAPAANLAVVPIVPIAMAGGVVALVGGTAVTLGAPPAVATIAGLPGWFALHAMVAIVRAAAAVPFAALDLDPALAWLLAGITGIALVTVPIVGRRLARRRDRRPARRSLPAGREQKRPRRARRLDAPRRALLIGLALVLGISSTAVVNATGRETRLTVLDIGQGDSILLESRTGARMLVDGGPDPDRLLLELDARIPPWDRRIDIVLLTHPHEDHVAGLVGLLSRYTVGRVFESGMRGPGPGWAAWDVALRDGPPRSVLATGAQVRLGEILLTVLWPDPGTVPLEPPETGTGINNESIVLLGEANGRRFLLMGDAEEGVDPMLLARGLPRVDVLKVAHHGSATATTQAFLDAVRPTVAIASVGIGNPYGHPAPSTMARIAASGARVLRTDRDGSVEVALRSDGIVVQTSGPRRSAVVPAQATSLGYDPSHDRHGAPRGRPPVALPGSARVVPAAFMRRRGRGGMAGGPRRGTRPHRRYGADRGRRAAARRGQAALGRGPGPPPPR